MIVTDLEHITHQGDMTLAFTKAIEFLRLRGLHDLSDGKVEIEGNSVFAIIQRYETHEADVPTFECHQKYIDVQYLVSGEEIIGWAPAESMTITAPYDAEKDAAFGTIAAGKWTPVYLQPGQAAVFWPEDGHAPKLAAGATSAVMKIVVKIAV